MISKIQLTNFQSHQDTVLEFVPGINTIIGTSDSGKSAILRALSWAINNRPSGKDFVSHWAKDEKGQKDECSVTIHKSKDSFLTRIRTASLNGYVINGKDEYEAIRTDVPDQVKDFFNLSEVNIQKQMDKPFLLDETAGEVARFFNRIIKLDEIDLALSSIEKKKRSCNSEIEKLKEDQDKFEKSLKNYTWIEKAEELMEKADEISAKTSHIAMQIENLTLDLTEYEKHNKTLEKSIILTNLEGYLTKYLTINEKLLKKQEELNIVSESYNDYKVKLILLKSSDKMIENELFIKKITKLNDFIIEKDKKINELSEFLLNFEQNSKKIYIIDIEMKEMEKQIPEVCPMCQGTGKLK